MSWLRSLTLAAALGFTGATAFAQGHAGAAGGIGGLGGVTGGGSISVSSPYAFGPSFAVSSGYSPAAYQSFGFGSYYNTPYGAPIGYGGFGVIPFNQASGPVPGFNAGPNMNGGNPLIPDNLNPTGVGLNGSARSDPSATATLNGADNPARRLATPKAKSTRRKSTRKR